MADEKIPVPSFDLGIQDSELYGSMQAAEDFLSSSGLDEDSDDLEPNTPKATAKTPAKATPPKKEEAKKEEEEEEQESPEDAINSLLGDDEDEEEEEEKVPNQKEPKTEDEPEENEFKALSQELYKLGVFTTDEDEEPILAETGEQFLERFNEEKRKGAMQFLDGYIRRNGDDREDLFQAIFVNGVDPRDYLPTYNEMQDIEGLDLENESVQEQIVRNYYKEIGYTDERINKKVDQLKSYMDLEDEAKNVHPILLEKKKAYLAELEEQKAQELARNTALDTEYKNSLAKVLQEKVKEKNLKGIPLNPKDAEEVFSMLYHKKWKTPKGELLTEVDRLFLESKKPENIEQRIAIALLYKNNFDFSKIEKKAISKESNELFTGIKKKSVKDITKQATATRSRWNV